MRLITVLGVLSVATAIAAGSAAGATIPVRGTAGAGETVPVRPDDRGGAKGPGAIAGVSVVQVRPDDRGGAKGPGAIAAANSAGPIAGKPVRPDDRAGLRGPGAFTVPATTPNVEVVRVASDGFAWPAAFVGAVSTLALCLLVGAALVLRPRGRAAATS